MSAPGSSPEEADPKQLRTDSSGYVSDQSGVRSLLLAERRTLEMIAEGASLTSDPNRRKGKIEYNSGEEDMLSIP